ncbi:MAG: hypothetical protein AAFW97_16185 [Pseudomonadota bacterium]
MVLLSCSDGAPQSADDNAAAETAADHEMMALPIENRVAFMTGHVEAGLALYRAGELEMAAPHLLHPVSETHAAERAGLDELGFEPALFETVSEALEQGRPATEIEEQLRAAQANLREVRERSGGDPAEIIRFLMTMIVEEYEIAITDGSVSDPGEYQDAYGFSVVAREMAESLGAETSQAVASEIDALLALWPQDAPIPPSEPASVDQVTEHVARVTDALPSQ